MHRCRTGAIHEFLRCGQWTVALLLLLLLLYMRVSNSSACYQVLVVYLVHTSCDDYDLYLVFISQVYS